MAASFDMRKPVSEYKTTTTTTVNALGANAPETPVEAAVSQIDRKLTYLDDALSELVGRLAPVLSNGELAGPDEGGAKTPHGPTNESPLEVKLNAMAEDVERKARLIHITINRLRL